MSPLGLFRARTAPQCRRSRRPLMAIILLLTAVNGTAAEAVKLVTGNDYAPLTGETLPDGGRATELVQRVFDTMGRPSVIVFAPWARGYQATLRGQFHGTFPYVRTPARAEEVHFSDPLFIIQFRVLVSSDAAINEPADLINKSLCVPNGFALSPAVERLLAELQPARNKPQTMVQCLRMLERGRVDFLVITRRHAEALLKEDIDDLKRLEALKEVKIPATLHLIVPKNLQGGDKLLAAFNQALAQVRQQEVLETINADRESEVR